MKIAVKGPDSLPDTDLKEIIDTWGKLKNRALHV